MATFKEVVLSSNEEDLEVLENMLDDFTDEWHDSESDLHFHEYLGMSWEEYSSLFGGKDLIDLVKSWREND